MALSFWVASAPACRRDGEGSTDELPVGAACKDGSPPWCGGHARCFGGVCTTYTAERAERDTRHVESIAADAHAQSNAAADPVPGGVVIRTAKGEHDHVFAACKANERLLGGGCQTEWLDLRESYPEATKPGDTIGGRWHCRFGETDAPLATADSVQQASALCQSLATQPSISVD